MYRINKAHPWHGITIGDHIPQEVTVFIEIVPRDTVKYEIDKETGYLKIDRPQQYSNVVPANYGFIPQTFCGENIARLAGKNSGRTIAEGDGHGINKEKVNDELKRAGFVLKEEFDFTKADGMDYFLVFRATK
jgi:inorganic pyrophosphatase